MPWIVKAFVNLMWPFVDPATKKKVKFGSAEGAEIVKDGEVAEDQLLVECGGDLNVSFVSQQWQQDPIWSHEAQIPYDHERYWPELLRVSKEKRDEYLRRFVELGPRVGMEERMFKESTST